MKAHHVFLAIFGALISASALGAPAVTLREVASGLSSPVELVNARDGSGRLFVVEQFGKIKILQNGTVLPTPFLDLSTANLISTGGERGLLGLAFHPQYSVNGAFYVFYTRAGDGALTIARYLRKSASPNEADPDSAAVILTILHPTFANHNGGRIAFGPDGYLYIGAGDGGGSGDPGGNAQNLTKLLGKLLRISVDGGVGYTIPPSNPFSGSTCGTGACPEIWAYGLRNPWKFSFDRMTGDLIIGDVGQDLWEEVDFQPAGSVGGRNYGWPIFEGNSCFATQTECNNLADHTPPIIEYSHNAPQGGFSITGGYRYRGSKSIVMRGYYVYGDLGARIWVARPDGGGQWQPEVLFDPEIGIASISSFGEDETGELYVVDYGNGKIWALDGPPPGIARSDSNADGRSDVFWRHTDGTNYVWNVDGTTINGGVLSIASQGMLPGVPGPDWAIVGIGDFNGDTKADILWRHTNGTNYVWHLDGSSINGGVLSIVSQGRLPTVDGSWSVAGIGDFNGDGKADILWRRNDGTNRVWHIDGATINGGVLAISSQGALSTVDNTWTVAGVGDFNGDGKADILWRKSDGTNFVWHVNGASISGGMLSIASTGMLPKVDMSWGVVGVGDFNGDGKLDILWRRNDGKNYVWHVNGAVINGGVLSIPSQGLLPTVADMGWSVVGVGDYNRDGKADVLWRHTNGANYVWQVDGTVIIGGVLSIVSQGRLPTVIDMGWQVQNPK